MHIPPPVYMVLAIIGIFYGKPLLPGLSFYFVGQQFLALVLAIVGLAIAIVSVQRFRQKDTTIQPHKLDEAKHLVNDGLYNYTRNPMYLGMAILILSAGVYFGTLIALPMLAIFVLVINKLQIEREEAALEKIFGQQYLDFKQRVRRWI